MRRAALVILILLVAGRPATASADPVSPMSVPGDSGPVAAWQIALGRLDASRAAGATTTVAVIDGRLGPEGDLLLAGRIATRQDAVRAGTRRAGEVTEHALLVSGVLAGSESGACPACRVVAVGTMQRTRFGVVADQGTLAIALRRARRAGARVVNMSLGGFVCTPALRREVARTIAAGVVIVAAAGNNPGQQDLLCPASLPDVISVGAITHTDQTLRLTYAGQTLRPTVWAQGEWVLGGDRADGSALWGTGSSFAAPQVAGVVATLLAQPGWQIRDRAGVRRVIARLTQSARPLPDGRLLLDAASLLAPGAAAPAAFADAGGRMVADTRSGGARELCAADGAPFQVRGVGTLTGAPAAARDETGGIGAPSPGVWTRVAAVELPAGGLYSLTAERPANPGRRLVLVAPGECPTT